MIQELHANMEYLRTHGDLPLHEERGRLDVIEHNKEYLNEEEYMRLEALREHLRQRLRGIPGIGS